MKSSQVKWLLAGLVGSAICMTLLIGGVFYLAMNVIPSINSNEKVDWSNSDSAEVIDAPAEWRQWAQRQYNAKDDNPEYQRLLDLYELVSPFHEIQQRLLVDQDFAFAEAELKKQFAAISDPLAALRYSNAVGSLSEFTYDMDPEKQRDVMRRWTEAFPESHFAWLIRGEQAKNYAWYWRGSGRSNTVSDEGWEYFIQGIDEAAAYFEKAYELEPNDPEIAVSMLTVCRAQSRPREEMEEYFERAVAVTPANLGAYSQKFQFLRPAWSGSWPEYEEFLESIDAKLAKQDHPILRIAKRAAQDNMESEQYDDVPEELTKQSREEWLDIRQEMADRWPDDVLSRAHYARELMRVNRFADAVEQFEWIGDRYPLDCGWSLPYFHERRLHAYHRTAFQRRSDERMELCQRALEIDPGSWVNHQMIGGVHYFNKDYDLAEEAALRSIELAPNQGGPHMTLANIYKDTGRPEDALAEIRTALQLTLPDDTRLAAEKLERELETVTSQSTSEPQ